MSQNEFFSSLLQQTKELLLRSPLQHLTISLFHHHQSHILIIISLLIIFLALIHSLYRSNRHRLPICWPILGMFPSLLYALTAGNIYEWNTKTLKENNGTYIFEGPFFEKSTVVTSNPLNLEYLLKTNFSNFPKGNFLCTNLRDLLGDGIFNADGEMWLQQRKAASIEFHSAAFRNLTAESLLELVHSRLLPLIDEKISVAFDLQDILLRLTFDNVCMIAFGVDPGSLSLGLPEIPFAHAIEGATEIAFLRTCFPMFVWKVMKFLNLGWERRLIGLIKQVDEFAEEVISTRREELVHSNMNVGTSDISSKTRSSLRSDLLTVFMGLKDDAGRPFSTKFLRDICVNFVLAGRDTSSVALSWFFWLLDQNPAVEERIIEELRRILMERNGLIEEKKMNNIAVFRSDEVKKMQYLQAALSESLRLYPPVPVDRKEIIEDDVFPDGTLLKKGMKLLYVIYDMGRMESIWGNDWREFKPERWLKDGQFINESPYKFTAFNGGRRLCLGKDFAYYQMKYVAASIIYHYKVKVVRNHPVEPKLSVTMYMKYGLQVTVKKRGEFDSS